MSTIYERIRNRRKELNLSADDVAEALNVSRATIYRYESSSIEKLPTTVLEPLCKVLKTNPSYLMGWEESVSTKSNLPNEFQNPQEAIEFILKLPTLAAYGGYNPSNMSDDTIIEFANEVLRQLELVSHKYK